MSDTTNDTFRIDRLTLRNFRCFEEKTIDFHPRFNVLIGDNGSGKTAVCEALTYGLARLAPPPDTQELRARLAPGDARMTTHPTEGLPAIQPEFPVSIGYRGLIAGQPAEATLMWPSKGGEVQLEMEPYIAPFFDQPYERTDVLPLFAYYGASRYSQEATATADDALGQHPRVYGYVECLTPAPQEMHLLRWVKRVEFVRAQEGRVLPALDAMKAAIRGCVPGYRDMVYRALEDRLTIDLHDGRTLPLDLLPDGTRATLAMVADMLWRASQLNPHLGAQTAQETPGLVLIDEIDLHLHPKWQRRIIGDLHRAFPRVQFIVTTHSPFIIQSLDAVEESRLIKLDEGEIEEEFRGRSIEDIVEDVQGVDLPQMSERRKAMLEAAEDYYRVLHEAKDVEEQERERLKRRLDELLAPFSDDVAYTAFLRMERLAAGLEGGGS